MNLRNPLILALIITGAAASPAYADWQWTRWGMTRAEAEQAAGAAGVTLVEATNSHPEQVQLNTTYKAIGFEFATELIFNGRGKLFEVVLMDTRVAECPLIFSVLQGSYGAPINVYRSDGYNTTEWRDERGGNAVLYSMMGRDGSRYRSCDIQYSALRRPGDLGL